VPKRFDVVTFGSATKDAFVKTAASSIVTLRNLGEEREYLAFEYGGKINADSIEFLTGGGATNTAVAFARLGLRAAACACVGRDEAGDTIAAELEREGVSTGLLVRHASERTVYSVVLSSFEGDRTVLTARAANLRLEPSAVDWAGVADAEWLYLTSLHGDSMKLMPRLRELARGDHVKLAFNPGSATLAAGIEKARDMLSECEVLLLNRVEAERLVGVTTPPRRFARAGGVPVNVGPGCERFRADGPLNLDPLFRPLADTGAKIVAITAGREGAQACDGRLRYLLPAFEVPVEATLGAGDAFGSAFTAEILRGRGVEAALIAGTANSASVVQKLGAKVGLLAPDGVERLAAEHMRGKAVLKSPLGVVPE
jgi:ribokinase